MKTDTGRRIVTLPVNRVEGDFELRAEYDGGAVSEAWSAGTMFRGIESVLVGRDAMDGLVLTSRICGLCSMSHLTAAVLALDMITRAEVPDNAKRLRNVCLMTEHIQSDMRQAFLMFAADFVDPAYQGSPLFAEALRRYEPFKGDTVVSVLRETKSVLEIIALLGGQWPHSAFMVPGGVVWTPAPGDILQCCTLLTRYRNWYERRILGCTLERWRRVRCAQDLAAWLAESDSHSNSDLGFFIRFAREAGLAGIGRGHGNFLSFGSLDLPGREGRLIPSGFSRGAEAELFDQRKISEHVAHSWYRNYDGGRHPFDGETRPWATGGEAEKYSWAKAPRYDDAPAETGPLAEAVLSKDPLLTDLVRGTGPSAFVRELARILRPATLIPAIDVWLREMTQDRRPYYARPGELQDGEGYGLVHAARGALGHWVKIAGGKIVKYQIITPTAWHASPRDSRGTRGPWEQALVGVPVRDIENPVELGHVIRSFDPCMVCCVHTFRGGSRRGGVRV